MKIQLIPLVLAESLSTEIIEELLAWNDEIAIHEDTGIYQIWPSDLVFLPKFLAFMIEANVWTLEETQYTDWQKNLIFALYGT